MVVTTADRVQLRLDRLVDDLQQPTDVAFAPDGRMFIAEQDGRVRVITTGRLQPQPALILDDIATTGDGGLMALVLDPKFDRTHFVYLIYTRPTRSGSVFCLARFREVGDTLAERVILLDNVSAAPSHPTASLRFGPDGKLYAAFDDGGDARRAGDMGSFNGKILRLNPDGTTPDDQAGFTPVYASDYRFPRGLDWQAGTGLLWTLDSDGPGSVRLVAVGSGNDRTKRAATKATFTLPTHSGTAALIFYGGTLVPSFRDNLLLADDTGGGLVRIRFNAQEPTQIVAMEHLLQDRVGAIRVVRAPSDGAIYLCTAHALARMAPADSPAAPR
jgi:glucose/arabinose dehydrogenase